MSSARFQLCHKRKKQRARLRPCKCGLDARGYRRQHAAKHILAVEAEDDVGADAPIDGVTAVKRHGSANECECSQLLSDRFRCASWPGGKGQGKLSGRDVFAAKMEMARLRPCTF